MLSSNVQSDVYLYFYFEGVFRDSQTVMLIQFCASVSCRASVFDLQTPACLKKNAICSK